MNGSNFYIFYLFQPKPIDTDRPGKQKRKALFDDDDLTELRTKCKHIIEGGGRGRERVMSALDGSYLVSKYSFSQLQVRLQFENVSFLMTL